MRSRGQQVRELGQARRSCEISYLHYPTFVGDGLRVTVQTLTARMIDGPGS